MTTRKIIVAIGIAGGAFLNGCAARHSDAAPAPQQHSQSTILVSSTPAAGSTVAAPVDELKLRFSPPARLDEVTISGPDGLMPAKVSAVGEVSDYSIPLSGLGSGSYTVSWKATSSGRAYQGSFAFTVK